MRWTGRLCAALLGLGVWSSAVAHEVRPGYLELRQTGPETYDVLWKVPGQGNLQLGISPALPEDCQTTALGRHDTAAAAIVERWTLRCPDGLVGRKLAVAGLERTLTDVLVRVQRSDGTSQVARLTPSASAFVVEAAPRWTGVATTYLGLGIEHILLGIDHLPFVLALVLLVPSWRRLVGVITAFTVAHSITLAAATLDLVHLPPQPVEAAIALSIVFVAAEIVHRHAGSGRAHRAPAVGRRVCVRPAARARVRGRAARAGTAGQCHPDGAVVLQSGRRARSAGIRRRGPRGARAGAAAAIVGAGVELAHRALWHRRAGDVLDDGARRVVLGVTSTGAAAACLRDRGLGERRAWKCRQRQSRRGPRRRRRNGASALRSF